MLEVIELLEKEIDRIKLLSHTLEAEASDLHNRAKYRKKEAERFQVILDILKRGLL